MVNDLMHNKQTYVALSRFGSYQTYFGKNNIQVAFSFKQLASNVVPFHLSHANPNEIEEQIWTQIPKIEREFNWVSPAPSQKRRWIWLKQLFFKK